MKTDLISKELFQKEMLKLESAFRVNPLSKESLTVYREYLSGVEESEFLTTVENIIKNMDRFPAIADFKKYLAKKTPVWL